MLFFRVNWDAHFHGSLYVFAVVICLISLICEGKETAQPANSTVRGEFQALSDGLAATYGAHDSNEFAAHFTLTAHFMQPYFPVKQGRSEVQAVITGLLSMNAYASLKFKTEEVYEAELFYLEYGLFTFLNSSGGVVDKGKYVNMYKDVNNERLIHYMIFNTDLPLPPCQSSK